MKVGKNKGPAHLGRKIRYKGGKTSRKKKRGGGEKWVLPGTTAVRSLTPNQMEGETKQSERGRKRPGVEDSTKKSLDVGHKGPIRKAGAA